MIWKWFFIRFTPPEQSENMTNYKPSLSTLTGWLRPSYFFSKRARWRCSDVQSDQTALSPLYLTVIFGRIYAWRIWLGDQTGHDTPMVWCSGTPERDFCDFHWGRLYWLYLFFPAGLRVCCTSHRSVHLMHKESIWHISFSQQAHKTASTGKKTQPMNALKWDPTQKTSWDELVHHEGDFFMLPFSWIEGRSPGHHVPTWKPVGFTRLRDAAQTRLMDAETWKVNSFSHQLTLRCFLCFFRLCFYSSCFLLGLVLRFFLLLFSYGFVGSVFFWFGWFSPFSSKDSTQDILVRRNRRSIFFPQMGIVQVMAGQPTPPRTPLKTQK